MKFTFPQAALLASLISFNTHASDDTVFATEEYKTSPISELNWLNQNFLDKQRKRANDLSREHYGSQFHGNMNDLRLLQRIINEELVEKDDTETLQSLGVIIGDVYTNAYKSLSWKVYEDDLGKSHAVCVQDTKECIFPVTMLSRRMEVGLKPDVKKVYEKGLKFVEPHMPKLPFSDKPY